MATIVLTGGGTGGHVIPSLALLPELKKKFDTIVYVGGSGIEKRLAEEKGLPFFQVETVKLDRTRVHNNIWIPFRLLKGVRECEKIFEKVKPDVVFSKGGYVALPACFAAKKTGVPIVCHESDYTMGLANKITSRFAEKTLTSFEETAKGICVGNPIRIEILSGNRERAKKNYPLDEYKKTVLVFGGSQGSAAINNVVYESLPALTKKYNILHISGKSGDFSIPNSDSYIQLRYASDMFDLFALSDMVVCRAGANTLFEIAAIGKPALCIPLPKGNSRGDQILNAEYFMKKGYVDVLKQDDLFMESLMYELSKIEGMRPPKMDVSKVNEKIVREVFSVVK